MMAFQARMCFLDTIVIRSIRFIDRNFLIYYLQLDEWQSDSFVETNSFTRHLLVAGTIQSTKIVAIFVATFILNRKMTGK